MKIYIISGTCLEHTEMLSTTALKLSAETWLAHPLLPSPVASTATGPG